MQDNEESWSFIWFFTITTKLSLILQMIFRNYDETSLIPTWIFIWVVNGPATFVHHKVILNSFHDFIFILIWYSFPIVRNRHFATRNPSHTCHSCRFAVSDYSILWDNITWNTLRSILHGTQRQYLSQHVWRASWEMLISEFEAAWWFLGDPTMPHPSLLNSDLAAVLASISSRRKIWQKKKNVIFSW